MPSTGEIKQRIQSIQETQKITNAMRVVSASKMNRAKKKQSETASFFYDIETVMVNILSHSADVENHYFDQRVHKTGDRRHVAILVLTGDKGLSGGYDINVCKKAEELIAEQGDANVEILIAGRMGQEYFRKTDYNVNPDFVYPVRNPTVYRGREIGEIIQQRFNDEVYDDIYVVYTRCVSTISQVPTVLKLLPLDMDDLKASLGIKDQIVSDSMLNYEPSPHEVFKVLVRKYINWIIYTCFVEAFTSEQCARMTAMKTASDNAEDMLEKLNLDFNRARQAAITQEITEIVGGAAAL